MWGADAQAIPAFARKYDMDCSHCHSMVPKLNAVGYYFHDNFTFQGIGSLLPEGLQEKVRSEDPEDQHPAYWPVSIRAAGGYQLVKRDKQLVSGPVLKTISTRGFGLTTLELLAGGLLAPDVSYYVTYYPAADNVGFPGQPPLHLHPGASTGTGQSGAIGFAWVGFGRVGSGHEDHADDQEDHQAESPPLPDDHAERDHDANAESVAPAPDSPAPAHADEHGGHGFNFRLGSHELEMTLSGHHRLSNAPYLAYRYIPEGHTTSLSLDAPQLGAAMEAHVPFFENLEYAVSLFNGPNSATDTNRALDVFVHLAKESKDHRIGLFALRGTTPVTTVTTPAPAPIPGTGAGSQPFLRYGADADLNFGPLNLLFFYMQGQDNAKLFEERAKAYPVKSVQTAKYYGGFIEADYLFESVRWMIAGRYDLIRNTAQGIATIPAQSNDADAFTLALKHDLILSSRGNLQLHLEANSTRTRAALVPTTLTRTDQTSNTIYIGVDLAF